MSAWAGSEAQAHAKARERELQSSLPPELHGASEVESLKGKSAEQTRQETSATLSLGLGLSWNPPGGNREEGRVAGTRCRLVDSSMVPPDRGEVLGRYSFEVRIVKEHCEDNE